MNRNISRFIISILLLVLIPINKSFANPMDIEYINVKLTRPLIQKNTINFSANGGFSLFDMNNKNYPIENIDEKNIKAVLNENSINLVSPQGNILFTLPKDGSILIASKELDNQIITVEKDSYRDYMRLIGQNNEIILINHVKLENYLYGVVPSEMPATFHMEALKAQAVASRSFTLSSLNKHSSEGYNLCDTTHCQAYNGFIYERPQTNLAVDETRDIFAYHNGKIIEAIYHSTSSGLTEDSVNVWGGDKPYLRSVVDEFSIESPYSSWSISINLNDIANSLISAGTDLGDIQGIQIMDTTSTGRVNSIKIIGSKGEKNLSSSEFRNMVGASKFRSTTFNIKNGNLNTSSNQVYIMSGNMFNPKTIDLSKTYVIDGKDKMVVNRSRVNRAMDKDRVESVGVIYPVSSSEILIEGKGFGHGVGMSQFGAKKMAELGYSFQEILKYYYTGIEVLLKN